MIDVSNAAMNPCCHPSPTPRPAASWRGRLWVMASMALLVSQPAWALKFKAIDAEGGGRLLVVYDCGKLGRETCADHEKSFHVATGSYPGDARTLDGLLKRERYREVLLVSGGGHLQEGVAVGEVLRRHQASVRVPKGAACVSACTVAFMGGLFRTVDDGATYEVHAYSTALRGLQPRLRDALLTDPAGTLEKLAKEEYDDAREWAYRLFVYFQKMIHGRPDPQRVAAVLSRSRTDPPYLTSPAFESDVARIRAEGAPAANEVAMAIERLSMEAALADLRARIDELGPRAPHALRMLETMFTSRIIGTASLSRETLMKLGYVTPIVSQ